ncbi:MAG: hydroxymethylbilane synthase [Proteobacteria bacterium]|nr:hydroxymethylbilane synthase [Pseudomonadota bacterium]
MLHVLRIGTRGSKLAIIQTGMVRDLLRRHHPALETEVVEILTSGDWQPAHGETRLSEAEGGKGLFAKEIEAALIDCRVDCGVHSMKDMPSFLPEGLVLEHVLPREDARDAFLSNKYRTLADLPEGAMVGTSSTRRAAALLAIRPDLKIVPMRGNVPTRIEKLRAGKADAIILALAGLNRLGLEHEIASVIEIEDMLPAACQGIVGIELRGNDTGNRRVFDALHCRETGFRAAAERAALQVLNGSCKTPIGAYGTIEDGLMTLRVSVLSLDGREKYEETKTAVVATDAQAAALGAEVGNILKERAPPALLAA